jgi:hypothetical protein
MKLKFRSVIGFISTIIGRGMGMCRDAVDRLKEAYYAKDLADAVDRAAAKMRDITSRELDTPDIVTGVDEAYKILYDQLGEKLVRIYGL